MTNSNALNIGAAALCFVLFWLTVGDSAAPDFYASWLAGEFFAAGDLENIYPPPSPYFTMQPPDAWVQVEEARGNPYELYPFLYPPLWAALVGWLAQFVTYDQVLPIATALNAAMITGMIVLAWRAARLDMPLWVWIAVAAGAMIITFVGYTAIKQNQPQILVSFLIVLAIERSRAKSHGTAGIALALAAAIKVYPAIFALLWLATREYRSLVAFAMAGAALAAASIAMAGWPLHAVFLEQLQTISNTVLMTPISYNLNALVAQVTNVDDFIFVQSVREITAEGPRGWHILEKGGTWSLASKITVVAALVGLMTAFARADTATRTTWLWPMAIGAITLLSPLSWSYHYLPVFAFLPALVIGLGTRPATLMLALLILPIQIDLVALYLYAPFAHNPAQLVGTVSMLGLTLAFGFVAFRSANRTATIPQSV